MVTPTGWSERFGHHHLSSLLLAVAVGLYLLGGRLPAQDLDAPRTLAELNTWYREPPTNQNAAVFFAPAFEAMNFAIRDWESRDLPWVGTAALSPLGSPLPAGMEQALAELVQRNKSALDYFATARRCEHCRFPIDLSQCPDLPLPHLTKLHLASELLAIDALWQANAQEGAQAGRTLLTGFGLARSLDLEPVLVSQLIRVKCVKVAVGSLEQALNRAAIPLEGLDELQSTVTQLCEHDAAGTGFRRGLAGTRLISAALFAMSPEKLERFLTDGGVLSEQAKDFLARLPGHSLVLEQQFMDETYETLLRAWKESYPGRFDAVDRVCATRYSMAKTNQLLARVFQIQELPRLAEKESYCLALLRMAQAAVALEHYRLAHRGVYPQFLSDLVPTCIAAIPNDPFDGRPLGYHRNGSGYALHGRSPGTARSLDRHADHAEGSTRFTVVSPGTK